LSASYADNANPNGTTSFASSSGAATLTVAPATTTITIKQMLIFPEDNFMVELVTALVTSSSGPVNGGIVTFNLNGKSLNVAVRSGQASLLTLLPLPFAAVPEYFSASFTPPNIDFAVGSQTRLALLTILNAINQGFVLFADDGSQVVATIINNIPFGLAYNSHGQFTGFALGILPNHL
jgi:hypothetical protein